MTYLIDTHAHIDMLDSPDEAIINAKNNNVLKIIVPGVEVSSVEKLLELKNKYDNVFIQLGIHPSEAKTWDDSFSEIIRKNRDKICAVGEIGLDYYWDTTFNDIQKEVFIKQIQLANDLELPIVVHDREAHKDTFDILEEYNKGSDVVMHCFSGSVEFARECVKKGWYLALGGVVTFKNAIKMKEVAKEISIKKLLLETDSPYLTPVPYRGKPNEPAYTRFVAEEIAKIKGINFNEVAEITTLNAENIFRI